MIGGDFNCLDLYRKNENSDCNNGRAGADRYLALLKSTFMAPVHCSCSQLDMFLISGGDSHRIRECFIEPITISDYAALKLKIGSHNQFKYWRPNVETNLQSRRSSLFLKYKIL